MAIFDYQELDSQQSIQLMETSKELAVYANMTGYSGLPIDKVINLLGKTFLNEDYYTNKVHVGLPSNWSETQPHNLKLSEDSLDQWGFYPIDSPITGHTLGGPQVKIVEHHNKQGVIDKLGIVYAGTNSLIDIPDYFQINENTITSKMNPLLEKVKEYAMANNISPENILITGYSLGAGMTNIMAKHRMEFADGFFTSARYIAHESPYIFEDPNIILNMGYENDAVFRMIGNHENFNQALVAADPLLSNSDQAFESSFDNIVLFNNKYASIFWNAQPFSILNIPTGWNAHAAGVTTDAVYRIAESAFYDFTERDSTIIVDGLTAIKRGYVWVEDKFTHTSDHYHSPAFIIGTQHNDLLKGNQQGDYIDGGAGDDKIKTGSGNDRVDGGEGQDKVIIEGNKNEWDLYYYDKETFFLHSAKNNELKQLDNVEDVEFHGKWLWEHKTIELHKTYFNGSINGSADNDHLQGEIIFAGEGNDNLYANGNHNLLHGGEGNDLLFAKGQLSQLFGAEGNDILFAGQGHNILAGGIGNDDFSFSQLGTTATITDFNQYEGDQDRIIFSNNILSDKSQLNLTINQKQQNVLIEYEDINITVENASVSDILNSIEII